MSTASSSVVLLSFSSETTVDRMKLLLRALSYVIFRISEALS